MGSRRIRPMTAADLALIPESCARCTFWDTSLAELASSADHVDRESKKAERARAVTNRWGYCGVLAIQDDELLGFLTLAPAAYVPRVGAFAATPMGPDAAMVTSVYVAPEQRQHGLGRQLVQSAAGLVARRDIRALEALGTYHDGPSCMISAGWLEAVGFEVIRPHPVTPRMRMNLQSTVRWRPDLGAAWSRLTGLVSQSGAPEPATYARRAANTGLQPAAPLKDS
jgi:ribosomal protein S18 acetylase RimI-like enzyme